MVVELQTSNNSLTISAKSKHPTLHVEMTVNEQKAKGAATSLGLRATAAAFIPLVRENQSKSSRAEISSNLTDQQMSQPRKIRRLPNSGLVEKEVTASAPPIISREAKTRGLPNL